MTIETEMSALILLAEEMRGATAPNPMVAAALYKDGQKIATGIHQEKGTPHAEVLAIKAAGKNAKDATLLVTLEPCTHYGSTPPCTNAILEAGIKKVIYATEDPNPALKTNPAKPILEAAGIEVISGICQSEAQELNKVYWTNQTQNRPYIILKAGLSKDLKLTGPNQTSQQLTGPDSQKATHKLRRDSDAILIGIATLLADNPRLSVRKIPLRPPFKNPRPIIIDPKGKTPKTAQLFKENTNPIIITHHRYPELVSQAPPNTRLSWSKLWTHLYKNEAITSILVEGGNTVLTQLLNERQFDELHLFISPEAINSPTALSFCNSEEETIDQLLERLPIKDITQIQLGNDLHITAKKCSNSI